MRKHPVMIGKQHTTERLRERLAQIDAPHGRTRSVFTHVVEGAALAEAEASDARAACGSGLGALDGLIISIKDLFDVKGEVTLAGGLPAPEGKAAIEDAAVVSALRAEGAVILGKTNMTEFAFSGLGLNPHYGTPANALDPLRIPGGSSSARRFPSRSIWPILRSGRIPVAPCVSLPPSTVLSASSRARRGYPERVCFRCPTRWIASGS